MTNRALVIIDLQIAMIDNPWNVKLDDWENLLSKVQTLIAEARKNNDIVIFIQHGDNDPDDPFFEGKPTWELIPELGRLQSEMVFPKSQGDAFSNPELAKYLRDNGVDEVVICGAQSEFCVRATTFGAIENNFQTIFISNAHGTIDNDGESAAQIIARINAEIGQSSAQIVKI